MPLPKDNRYTIEDIYNLPEGKRAELVDGQLYYMAPPSTTHQKLLNYLVTEVNLYIRNNGGDCEVYPAPFAVFLDDSDASYVEPDISVICDKGKLDEQGCHGAPDWVIEIVSPSSKRMDYYTKLYLYRAAGVREYWIVDPARKSVMVYYMEEDAAPVMYPFTETIRGNVCPDLEICCLDEMLTK